MDRLDDPDEWRKVPILDKETLRKLDDNEFYEKFCVTPDDGFAEYWRSGGSTGMPLFCPRSYDDIEAAMVGARYGKWSDPGQPSHGLRCNDFRVS